MLPIRLGYLGKKVRLRRKGEVGRVLGEVHTVGGVRTVHAADDVVKF